MKFKIGDKVKVVNAHLKLKEKYIGDVFTIRTINPNGTYCYNETHYGIEESAECPYVWLESELVEDKKMFTKSDLKNGDVLVRRNGNVEIAIVDLGVLVTKNGWNDFGSLDADFNYPYERGKSDWDIMKVYRPTKDWHCQFESSTHGELVYDRERDTKPLYNARVVCIDLNGVREGTFTVGKIYDVKDGEIITDTGHPLGTHELFHTFEDLNNCSVVKFIEIKE